MLPHLHCVPWCWRRMRLRTSDHLFRCTRVCMRHDMRPVRHELIHNLVPMTFLRTFRSGPHIHGLVFLIIVVDGTSFLPASLAVFCETRTEGHKFRMRSGSFVQSCTRFLKTSHKFNTHTANDYLANAIRIPKKLRMNIIKTYFNMERKYKYLKATVQLINLANFRLFFNTLKKTEFK